MNGRNLMLLVVLFVVLAAIIYIQDNPPESGIFSDAPTAQPTAVFTRVFPEMAVLDIQAIRLADPIGGATYTQARRTDGSWVALETEQPLNQNLATDIAQTMVLLPSLRTIQPTADDNLAQYGFRSSAQFLISILTTNGQEHVVAIGDPLQTGPEFYAIVDDEPEIYVIQRAPIDFLVSFLAAPPIAGAP